MSTPIVYLQSLLIAIGYLALAGSFVYIVLALIRLLFAGKHQAYGSDAISKRIFTRKLIRKQYPQLDDFNRADQDIGSHVPNHHK
jgi:hypothetical protein